MAQNDPNDLNSGLNSGTSGSTGSGGTSTGAGYGAGGTGMSSGGGMTTGSGSLGTGGGTGSDVGTGGSINSTGGASFGVTSGSIIDEPVGSMGSGAMGGGSMGSGGLGGSTAGTGSIGSSATEEDHFCTHCGQSLQGGGGLEGILSSLRGQFENVDIDEYLNTARDYLKGGSTKVTTYTRANPGKVAAGVAALAVGAGLIYAAVNREKDVTTTTTTTGTTPDFDRGPAYDRGTDYRADYRTTGNVGGTVGSNPGGTGGIGGTGSGTGSMGGGSMGGGGNTGYDPNRT